jgi:hypothetical protein
MTDSQSSDPFANMPPDMKPMHMEKNVEAQKNLEVKVKAMQPKKKMSWGRKIVWTVVIVIVIAALVQYFNAAKYSALVQVIKEDRVGVNPTGNALDFGDLPRDKSAVRTVNLVSNGNTDSYIIVWKTGNISDLISVDKNYFTLKAHTTDKLQFTAYIPNSANYQYYKGQVMIFQIPKLW